MGVIGPMIFLTKDILVHSKVRGTKLVTKYIFPSLSCVFSNKTSYMDDENLVKVMKLVVPAIRTLKVRNFSCFCLFYSLYVYK